MNRIPKKTQYILHVANSGQNGEEYPIFAVLHSNDTVQ